VKRLISFLSTLGAVTCCSIHADFINLESASAFAELIKRDKVVALFVYPPGQPCKNMLAVTSKVAKEEKDVTFVIVDIRTYGALKNQYQTGNPPALLLFSHGIELSRSNGQRSAAALKDFMARGFLGRRGAFMKSPLVYTVSWIRSHFSHYPVCENE
jgi:hypothetical protein